MFDNTILAANKEGRRALTLLMTFPSLRIVEMAARGPTEPPSPPGVVLLEPIERGCGIGKLTLTSGKRSL